MSRSSIKPPHVFQALTYEFWPRLPLAQARHTRQGIDALIRAFRELGNYQIAAMCGHSPWLVKKVRELGPDYEDHRDSIYYIRRKREARQLELDNAGVTRTAAVYQQPTPAFERVAATQPTSE